MLPWVCSGNPLANALINMASAAQFPAFGALAIFGGTPV
jgi:hypothetical protein